MCSRVREAGKSMRVRIEQNEEGDRECPEPLSAQLLLLFWSRASSTYFYENENFKKLMSIFSQAEAVQVCKLIDAVSAVVMVQEWSS